MHLQERIFSFILLTCCSDITKQEALWKKTLEMLKDQLSAEVLENCGTVLEEFSQDTSKRAVEKQASNDIAVTTLEEVKSTSGEEEVQVRDHEDTVKENAEEPLQRKLWKRKKSS